MKKLFQEQFDVRKLCLYLNTSSRGFVLLQVNDIRYEKEIMEIVSLKKKTSIYNLFDIGFRDSVEEIKVSPNIECVIYNGFHLFNGEKLRVLLEKINLSRDILSVQNKLIVFLVPRYIGRIIQEDYPNLYAYFILKEEYILNYEAIFEYVFPNNNYLFTKEAKNELKKYFQSNENNIEIRLDYYERVKAKEREYALLKRDFEKYMQKLKQESGEIDTRYFYSLLLRMGEVAANQGDYNGAREFYDSIIKDGVINAGYYNLYYDTLEHRTDIYMKEKKYSEALEIYENLISMIAIQHDYDMESVFAEYVIKILPRMGICHAKLKNYQEADSCMLIASRVATLMKQNDECFAILYNRVLLAFHMYNIHDNQIRPIFDELKKYIYNPIQEAMYDSLYAWYRGVIDGHYKHAFEYVRSALHICRNLLIENNTRIAECHFVNSILYLLSDELEKSNICRKKCISILENFSEEEERLFKIL